MCLVGYGCSCQVVLFGSSNIKATCRSQSESRWGMEWAKGLLCLCPLSSFCTTWVEGTSVISWPNNQEFFHLEKNIRSYSFSHPYFQTLKTIVGKKKTKLFSEGCVLWAFPFRDRWGLIWEKYFPWSSVICFEHYNPVLAESTNCQW